MGRSHGHRRAKPREARLREAEVVLHRRQRHVHDVERDPAVPISRLHCVASYLIAFGGLLLLSGRFGDILGRKSVFLAGLGVFTVASLLCGVARSRELLVAARFVQGIGGAMTWAVILGAAQVGGELGLAVLATLSATRSDGLAGDGEAAASALTGGYHLAFLVATGLVAAAIVVALAVLEPEQRAARRAAPGGQPSQAPAAAAARA